MADRKTVDPTPTPPKPGDTDLVVFGRQALTHLPPAIQALMRKYKTREVPGVAPQWKPQSPGESIAGVCVKYRAGVKTAFGEAELVILEGEYGFRSIFLGADLSQKLSAESVGRPMVILYEGEEAVPNRPTKMKRYRVIEVLEPEPDQAS